MNVSRGTIALVFALFMPITSIVLGLVFSVIVHLDFRMIEFIIEIIKEPGFYRLYGVYLSGVLIVYYLSKGNKK